MKREKKTESSRNRNRNELNRTEDIGYVLSNSLLAIDFERCVNTSELIRFHSEWCMIQNLAKRSEKKRIPIKVFTFARFFFLSCFFIEVLLFELKISEMTNVDIA